MSEYQYYEFRAIDKPLDSVAQKYVASLSSRVEPHPTRAIFTYSYSDFRGNPLDILERYYDAFFYIANWGTVRLAFRLPRDLVDVAALRAYCVEDVLQVHERGEHIIVEWERSDEDGFMAWIEGEGTLDDLLALRSELLAQDYRSLYLGWLVGVENDWEVEEDELEPEVPAGLDALTPALREFANIFELDENLIKAAARASASGKREENNWQDAITQLDADVQQAWLLRLANGEALLSTRFQQHLRTLLSGETHSSRERRTVGILLEQREAMAAEVNKQTQAKAEAARIKRMEALAPKEEETWREVEDLIGQKKGNAYDKALTQLRQLQELARYQGTHAEFAARVVDLRRRYSRLTAFQRRLNKL